MLNEGAVFEERRAIGFVDDEEDFLTDLKVEVGEKFNDETYFSSEIKDAIGWAEKRKIDTLVSDYRMDSLDGIQLLSTIRKMSTDIELILLTAFVLNEKENQICEALEINILFKNHGFDNILKNIQRIRDKSKKIPRLYEEEKTNKRKKEPQRIPPAFDDRLFRRDDIMNEKLKKHEEITEIIVMPLVDQIVAELSIIKQKDADIYIGEEILTVNELINEVKNLTPLGIDHIRMWTNAFTTLKKLGKG